MLNTASGMYYYGKLHRPPQATPCLEPVDGQCSVQV